MTELYNAYYSEVEQCAYITYKNKTLFFTMHPIQAEKLLERVKLQ